MHTVRRQQHSSFSSPSWCSLARQTPLSSCTPSQNRLSVSILVDWWMGAFQLCWLCLIFLCKCEVCGVWGFLCLLFGCGFCGVFGLFCLFVCFPSKFQREDGTGSSADLTHCHSIDFCGALPVEGSKVHGWASRCAGKGKGNMAPRPCQWSICRPCEWHFCIKGWYYEKILIQREGTVINWESRSVLPVCTSPFTWIPAASCRTELALTFNSADAGGLSWSATTEAGRKEHLGASSWGWWDLAELLVSFATWKVFSLFLTIIILSYDLSPLICFWYSCQVT